MKDKHLKDVKFLRVEETYSLSGSWTDEEITDAVTKVVSVLGEKYDKSVMFAFLKEVVWYGTDKISFVIVKNEGSKGCEDSQELRYSMIVKTARPGIFNGQVVPFPTVFMIAAVPSSGELAPKERSRVTQPILSGLTYRLTGAPIELSNFFSYLKPGVKFYEASGELVLSHFDAENEHTPHPRPGGKDKWNYIGVGYANAPFVYGIGVVFSVIQLPRTIRE